MLFFDGYCCKFDKKENMKARSVLVAGLMGVLSLTACNKEKVTVDNTKEIINEGEWKVTYFEDNGENETYYFDGYVFTFNDNGTVVAVNGSQSVSGSWSVKKDDGHVELDLTFPATANFDELDDDWHVVEQTTSKVVLEDPDDDGPTDYLTFEKI